jgi:16S rRNA (cytosine967-C5)-methyltransferase
VRRHPDAKWLRRESDLAGFAREQSRLLDALWQTLAPDGKLLYATCSLFPEENSAVVQNFAARQADARRLSLPELGDGQLLPTHEHDGFFYALLEKI